ncbi:MAG: YhgE/Pip domain-containing protein [Microbacteriaceae bacterium]|nr:MAG: YhgE/Pip domain-containing protein [Microbacteriaceae bacterium]
MKIRAMIQAELRRLTATPLAKLALAALCIIPILYGGLYLWANEDPYANLDRVPVALVVDDEGGERAGEHVVMGDDVAERLLDSGTFDWHEVSAEEAEEGLEASRYDFTLTIPADFTDALLSVASDDPRQARLELTTNDAGSYLASTIGKTAATTMLQTIAKQVVEEAAAQLLDGIADIRAGMADAADGAATLADGAAAASDGARRLADGTAQLAAGAAQVADGNTQLAATADRVADAATRVRNALPETRAALTEALAEQGLTQEQIDAVLERLAPISTAVDVVDTRVQSAVGSIDRLAGGARQLSAGAATAASGAASLADGVTRLDEGAATLRDGLSEGLAQIPDPDAALRAAQAAAIADPVALETSNVAAADSYGAGLAPFFAALAAWIGMYALFLIVKPVSPRAITALHSPVKVTLAGWLTPGLFGALQMGALFLVLNLVLGFSMAMPWAVLGTLVLASLCFAAIVLALNVWLGSTGQFLGLVLMVLQLVTAGGTFPWQTLPEPLAALHHVLPMGFAVDAVRQFMYDGDIARTATDALVLGAWTVGALVIAGVGVTRMTHFRTLRDLEPSLLAG